MPSCLTRDGGPTHAPLFMIKEACVNMLCVKLTNYIQLSHAVFDAAAVSGDTRVSAGVICSDVFNQQGAIGHLL